MILALLLVTPALGSESNELSQRTQGFEFANVFCSDSLVQEVMRACGVGCAEAGAIWPAHAEAVADRAVRAAKGRELAPLHETVALKMGFSGRLFVGRPVTDMATPEYGRACAWHKARGRGHAQMHPRATSSLVPNAWYDGRNVWFTGALAALYEPARAPEFTFILAHEMAHAVSGRSEAECDRIAKTVAGPVDAPWLERIRTRTAGASESQSGPPQVRF